MAIRLNDEDLTDITFAEPSPDQDRIPSIPRPPHNLEQLKTNWCWAACAELIIKLFQGNSMGNISQCLLAQRFADIPDGTDCCRNMEVCNKPLGLEAIKAMYKHFRINAKILLAEDEELDLLNREMFIREQIRERCPIEIYTLRQRRDPNKSTGHVMIVYGWSINRQNQFCLLLKDPEIGIADSSQTLDDINTGIYNGGRWVAAIADIKKI